jgi:hypothetical protein
MALDELELSLMAFPQNWDAVNQKLNVNLLLLPVGDPTKPLGSGPVFAGTPINVKALFIEGLDSLPLTTSPIALTTLFVATPPPAALALFQGLGSKLPAGTTVTSGKLTRTPDPAARIKKSLPASYTNAFPFERSQNGDITTGDGYGCAVRAQSPGTLNPTPQPPPPKIIAWGQIISYILRQPLLAQAVGLVYPVPLSIPAATVQNGGWLFFRLDDSSPANPYVNDSKLHPDSVKSYAARIPPLDKNNGRRMFAAMLFPILALPDSKYVEAQFEAEIYDDGFAQIVHCNQPQTADAATLDPDQIPPGSEVGIQVGWDDEQVTVWLNRQIDLLRDRVGGTTVAPEAPLGVQAYRVDVQLKGDTQFHSLCDVVGSLPFSASTNDGSGFTPSGELFITPAPVRPVPANWTDPNPEPALLPLYFAHWRGSSLVVHDDTISQITPGKKAMPSNLLSGDLTGVPILRYGQDYQFRVRCVDLTGGGPLDTEGPVHPGVAPNGFCAFRRFIPPKSLEVDSTPPPPKPPAKPLPVRIITQLDVRRPRIGYPEAIFAGVDPGVFTGASLTNLIADAQASGRALSVADPDVDRFQVIVEARIPVHDTGTQGIQPRDLDGDNYRVIYSIVEHFHANGDPDPTVTLSLDYSEQDDIATIVAPVDDSPTLTIPTARDVRVRLIPLSADRSNYYGTPQPPQGSSTDFIVRKEAASEDGLYNFDPPTQLKALFFQPGNDLPQLLAQNLGLKADGLKLAGPVAKRVVFAAAAGLRHTLSSDASAITFANQAELLDHWIVALVVDIERDWTWDGFAEPALTIFRDALTSPVGTVTFYRTVGATALGNLQRQPDRSTTRVVFFDSLNPQPPVGGFPDTLNPKYTVVASFKSAPDVQNSYNTLVLPITTRPDQTPKIVSTGIAESPFQASPDYSQTFLRDRFLWIEFDRPIADDNDDTYFGRVLGYGPDPLLAAALLPPQTVPPTDEPPLSIDPEPARMIFAGQSADFSGVDAMDPLIQAIPAGDGVHYLLALPPGIDPEALDLFGFWTYEFRVGHQKKWSTAQARFGRPLRVTGIQHPVPHLTCTTERTRTAVVATAPYATTVLNGVRVYDLQFGDPQTVLWFMLYTQVVQTDGAAHRNILLSHKRGCVLPDWEDMQFRAVLSDPRRLEAFAVQTRCPDIKLSSPHAVNREPRGYTFFSEKEIIAALSLLGLPLTSPLSVLAVEVLPGPFNFTGDSARRGAAFQAGAATAATAGEQEDPLGTQLGARRILRSSPLTPVPAIC